MIFMETIQLIIDTYINIVKIAFPIGLTFLLAEKVITFATSFIFNGRARL